MIVLQIIFWLLVLCVFHTYIAYPAILFILSRKKSNKKQDADFTPNISVIMSLFNEESVIEEKLNTILKSNYPKEKIQIIIGSDNSNDGTNKILEKFSTLHNNIDFTPFKTRQGKANVINQLVEKSNSDFIILSDANVMFEINTIRELMSAFKDENVGLVDANMINTGLKKEGISIQEKTYISREVNIKNMEGSIWGCMMGPFGGCFAMRRELYTAVPSNFLVDDFYLCMKVLQAGKKTLNNVDAVVFEDVSNNLADEFKRKVRIATGNFQNLNAFKSMLWPPFSGIAFCFLSHKVLRWLTPLFIIITYILLTFISIYYKNQYGNNLYFVLNIIYSITFVIPILDYILKKINIHIVFFRFITYFYSMNLAMIIGMFKAIKGVKTNVWKPTKRNQ